MARDTPVRSDFQDNEAEGLDELVAPAPEQNLGDSGVYRRDDLESERQNVEADNVEEKSTQQRSVRERSNTWLEVFYTGGYLSFFSIFGVLARLGLVALTKYPGAPVADTVLWANVGGSLLIGMLREDRLLFRAHYRQAKDEAYRKRDQQGSGDGTGSSEGTSTEQTAEEICQQKRASLKIFIGLTVGFCGSLTSFSEICRNAFLAISDDFDTYAVSNLQTTDVARGRQAGYSVMAVIAVLWLQIAMSYAALMLGASLAQMTEPLAEWIPELAHELPKHTFDLFMAFLGYGTWLGAAAMAIWTPHDAWRGQAVFALVFAPFGCLLRFVLSLRLNRAFLSFPLGTFTANFLGTLALAACFDLQHLQIGGLVGCQVLQGVQDGYSGALTTVSTWVLELKSLKLRHAFIYGTTTVVVSMAGIIAIMSLVRWIFGFSPPTCEI